ncbi:band 7 protein AGAP004871-like [Cimex lectularius]|uniref:Band 7 domain-containing protein n=1 Tax=Cimex lectularius TaxID=79782 RepID=A0A8I6RY90_CIMLE|nr:band 7 protein AGAP004871-like [Cimex lectularius]
MSKSEKKGSRKQEQRETPARSEVSVSQHSSIHIATPKRETSSLPRKMIQSQEKEMPYRPTKKDLENPMTYIYSEPHPSKMTKCFEVFLIVISYAIVILTVPISLFFTFRIVNQYEKAVVFRLGRLKKHTPGPGLFFLLPCIDVYINIDLRLTAMNVPSQEVLTKDSCTVNVTAIIYYTIQDPIKVVASVQQAKRATMLLASTALRNVMGHKDLTEILSERKAIAVIIGQILEHTVTHWGIKVDSVDIKDVSLPDSMQRAMASEAEAYRDARAKVINAEGELNSAEKLRQAAQVISRNPVALQLRYLQTLNTVAANNNNTIAFPLPMKWQRQIFK